VAVWALNCQCAAQPILAPARLHSGEILCADLNVQNVATTLALAVTCSRVPALSLYPLQRWIT
jgi:hypothetical protein